MLLLVIIGYYNY